MKDSDMSGEFIHFSKLISTISRSSGGSFLKNTLFTVPSLVGRNGGHGDVVVMMRMAMTTLMMMRTMMMRMMMMMTTMTMTTMTKMMTTMMIPAPAHLLLTLPSRAVRQ